MRSNRTLSLVHFALPVAKSHAPPPPAVHHLQTRSQRGATSAASLHCPRRPASKSNHQVVNPNRNPKHVSHRRTSSPQTLKFPSCQIGSARLDAPSMRHACTHIRRAIDAPLRPNTFSRDAGAQRQKNCPTSGRLGPLDACMDQSNDDNRRDPLMNALGLKRDERRMASKRKWQKSTAPGIPRRSPIQVLTGPDVA